MKTTFRAKLKLTPDLIGLARGFPNKFPALLASTSINAKTGRYSLLLCRAKKPIKAFNVKQLKQLLKKVDNKIATTREQNELPFHSGWFLYLSYASIKAWEKPLRNIKHDKKQPLAIAIRCKSAIIIDHVSHESWLVANSQKRLKKLQKRLNKFHKSKQNNFNNHLELQNDEVETYIKNVEKAKQYIKQGDVYQVNLARYWQVLAKKKIDALALFHTLSQHNPAPFAGFLQSKNFSIISSSPERLVKLENNIIESRPIAGTRPRHKDPKIDQELIEELVNHPKEQAEHIMLIDLERNDLGRVSEVGSVSVDEFMVVESYKHVHHIVSNVIGRLKPQTSFYDVIKAVFPGGTITGCPKIRCMQIIDELENQARGAYTGSMGYISDDGKMDLNILIRSFALVNNQLSFQAGAGIVYDSIAKNEAQESMHKAHALISSLEYSKTLKSDKLKETRKTLKNLLDNHV